MKIVWVWHKKIQIFKLDIQTRFVSFLSLHFTSFLLFLFFSSSNSPNPSICFQNPRNQNISLYSTHGKIDLKEIDSVHFSYLHWSVVRKKGELNVADLKVKIGYYHVTPKPIEDLNRGKARAHFRVPLKRFSPT